MLILKEFEEGAAMRTFHVKDGIKTPLLPVLSRTLSHFLKPVRSLYPHATAAEIKYDHVEYTPVRSAINPPIGLFREPGCSNG